MAAQHRQRRTFIAFRWQNFKTVNRRETDVGTLAQRLNQLNAQTTQIVMIAAKADLSHLVCGDPPEIAQLIAKTAVDMGLQHFGDLTSGKPAVIIKYVNAGLGIPMAVQYLLGDVRSEIATVHHFPLLRMKPRAVASNEIGIQRQRFNQRTHLQHVTTGGKS